MKGMKMNNKLKQVVGPYVPQKLRAVIASLKKRISTRQLRRNARQLRRNGLYDLLPPADIVRVSDFGQYAKTGEDWADKIIKLGGLESTDRVLEVGCGNGRVAIWLTRYLTSGEYYGFDIRQDEIQWLSEHVTAKFPSFHFSYSPVHNAFYNPNGSEKADCYEFPFPDGYFDFAYLTSIFTHMLPSEAAHYLSEIHRVLKPGGRCFISYFLLTPESRKGIASGCSSRSFEFETAPHCFTDNMDIPEDALAYEKDYLEAMYRDSGFQIIEPIYYGQWFREKEINAPIDYQDIVLAENLDE